MSSKIPSGKNSESKFTRCETCHQDILSEKMFLHEGFCRRNNIFCEHCEKVFLKTDFDEHLKDLRNSINSAKSTDIDEKENIPVIKEIKQTITTVVNPNIRYEFVEMPSIEEYKINTPIIISENGNILSSGNNNEYILPYLGINVENKDYRNIFEQNNCYSSANNEGYLDYINNQGISTNVMNIQNNYINNYANYSFNNYQNNSEYSYNNEKKIKTSPIKKYKKIKLEKIPRDNHSKLNIHLKSPIIQSKYQYNTERNINPIDFNKEYLTIEPKEVRINKIKVIKKFKSPRRITTSIKFNDMLK